MPPRALRSGGGSRKSPRPRTPGQGCALWPPCPGISPEAHTPSMTEPRTPPRLGQSLPGFEEVGLSWLPRTSSARPPSPSSSPANRPQRAASPSADGRGAPGAAAAPSRAWPGRAPAPAALQLARPAPARARPGPGPAAPSSVLWAPGSRRHTARAGLARRPGPEGAGRQVRAARGRGHSIPGRGHLRPRPRAARPAVPGHCACALSPACCTLRAPWSPQAILSAPLPRLLYLPRLWLPRLRASRTGFLGQAVKLSRKRRGLPRRQRALLEPLLILHS